jgi:hypothetical protein
MSREHQKRSPLRHFHKYKEVFLYLHQKTLLGPFLTNDWQEEGITKQGGIDRRTAVLG